MVNSTAPKLSKWPFYLADILLLSFAGLVIYLVQPFAMAAIVASGVAVLAGAGLSVVPYLFEYRAAIKQCETGAVVSTVAQIQNLEVISAQVRDATASWQTAHEMAVQTSQTAKEITDRMVSETKSFKEFLQKANEAEKSHLRLEVEKLRRAETEWLQITITMLDHIFALFQAGVRSGQTGLIEQLGHFQGACRDVVRRVGLVPFAANADEPFDARAHQVINGQTTPSPKAVVRHTIATGYLYQGQLLRRALVELQPDAPVEAPSPIPLAPSPELATEPTEPTAAPPAAKTDVIEAPVPAVEAPVKTGAEVPPPAAVVSEQRVETTVETPNIAVSEPGGDGEPGGETKADSPVFNDVIEAASGVQTSAAVIEPDPQETPPQPPPANNPPLKPPGEQELF